MESCCIEFRSGNKHLQFNGWFFHDSSKNTFQIKSETSLLNHIIPFNRIILKENLGIISSVVHKFFLRYNKNILGCGYCMWNTSVFVPSKGLFSAVQICDIEYGNEYDINLCCISFEYLFWK